MSDYVAPIHDMKFVMTELAGLSEVQKLPGYEEATTDLVDAVLEEAGKFATNVLSPINAPGDREGAHWKDNAVTTAKGWKEAYTQFAEAGWNALACDPAFGGQGLPKLLNTAVIEMWKSANMAFALCPMLTNGAIEALHLVGSDAQKQMYLPKMVSGEWTGTMNLTEPQAGSDLAAVRTRAEPVGDGTYKIFGQKIFITYGDHDMTDNIIHLVLARTPGAPEGLKGISLFVVPKFFVNADGSLGARNDVYCTALEHKLGIHASPTAVLVFGDNGGAVGTMVGEEGRGLEYMFIMMNEARFAVGMEGLAISERAYQKALEYAKERIQGTEVGVKGGPKVPILRHPDVRRMLLSMKSRVEGMRAVACVAAAANDAAHHHPDAAVRAQKKAFTELMTPIVKGFFTESSVDITSLGVQVHGGMGFIEETGAAQYLRDSRITPIYEGTTAIQANDLIGRKIARDKGEAIKAVIAEMQKIRADLGASKSEDLQVIGKALEEGIAALTKGVDYNLATYGSDIKAISAAAVPLLKLFGTVACGWQLGRAALVAQKHVDASTGDKKFYRAKIKTARFYADHELPMAQGYAAAVLNVANATLVMEDDAF